ncbi:hypothetical protein SAMN05216588_101226 [Pseudomonas flavescens]|uniref:Uncharacterized protein n=1 Tax=Phytopseudomonas flavescens TaxID=29435 RepID=A0A1G7XQK6_9GAMM|nr:hypothetical protein [Pseudomonas flavescens]SDG86323.1 hypothetical protein SAMN05216588_101226 [Pseudomonas flavescens]
MAVPKDNEPLAKMAPGYREMLELAARAAGYEIVIDEFTFDYDIWLGDECWDPLTCDGDALRLAVKLEINILPTMEQASCRNPEYTGWINEDASRDPFAATRRAIVRAAAEIGSAMP